MAWEETRGSSRVVLAAARHVAHADDAKARTDEATRLRARSLRPRVLAGVGAAVIVLALIAFLTLRGGADDARTVALVKSTPSASATPTEPSPADVLEESHPSGLWKLVIVGRTLTTRGGTTKPLKDEERLRRVELPRGVVLGHPVQRHDQQLQRSRRSPSPGTATGSW